MKTRCAEESAPRLRGIGRTEHMKQSSLPSYPFVFTTPLPLKWLSHISLPPHIYQLNSTPFFFFTFLSFLSTLFLLCLLSDSNSFLIPHPFPLEQSGEILIVLTYFKVMTQIKVLAAEDRCCESLTEQANKV